MNKLNTLNNKWLSLNDDIKRKIEYMALEPTPSCRAFKAHIEIFKYYNKEYYECEEFVYIKRPFPMFLHCGDCCKYFKLSNCFYKDNNNEKSIEVKLEWYWSEEYKPTSTIFSIRYLCDDCERNNTLTHEIISQLDDFYFYD